MPTNCLKYKVMLLLILVLMGFSECLKKRAKTKLRKKVDNVGDVISNNLSYNDTSNNFTDDRERSRGFFGHGLFSLGKVLNFFPVGGERECQPSGYTVARAGICLNQYDCHQREGRAAGDCAHGLGVCCVFEVTCGGSVQNNLTYFMSPGFPELWAGEKDCNIIVEKTHAGVTQLRIDFVHFTIGQPNRSTGECDEDVMVLGEGDDKFVLCGQNHGQHIYYTLPSGTESREADDLPGTKSTRISIRMRGSEMPRLWLLRLAQLPLAHTAPHDCLQYHTADNGTIKTFNFAINGRHLAGQDYRACVRRNVGRCAVRYTPCDQRSFRIGPGRGSPYVMDPEDMDLGPGESGGPGTGYDGPDGQFEPMVSTTPRTNATGDQQAEETQNGSMEPTQMMPADDEIQDEEGSGADPQIAPVVTEAVAPPSFAARVRMIGDQNLVTPIWSYIWPSWLWGQSARSWGWSRWSPYAQHYTKEDDKFRYYGYGNFGVGLKGHGRRRCTDRLTIPCENEYFVASSLYVPGVCDPHHCGGSFCPGSGQPCHVETSVTPFAVSVHFGPPSPKRSPEENIGACLRYTQLPCED